MIDWFIVVDNLEPKLAKKIHWFENEREAVTMAQMSSTFHLISGVCVIDFLKKR